MACAFSCWQGLIAEKSGNVPGAFEALQRSVSLAPDWGPECAAACPAARAPGPQFAQAVKAAEKQTAQGHAIRFDWPASWTSRTAQDTAKRRCATCAAAWREYRLTCNCCAFCAATWRTGAMHRNPGIVVRPARAKPADTQVRSTRVQSLPAQGFSRPKHAPTCGRCWKAPWHLEANWCCRVRLSSKGALTWRCGLRAAVRTSAAMCRRWAWQPALTRGN